MIRTNVLHRPAGLTLCLLVLAATSGCAHFQNAELRAQQRADAQRTEPSLAQAAPRSSPAPMPSPPPPAPKQAPTATQPPVAASAPAPEVAAQATSAAPDAAASAAEPSASVAPPLPAAPPLAAPTTGPATGDAVIVFANIPAAQCTTCETLKISVAPSGQVLMERGSWSAGHSNWRYKRSHVNVGPARAAAFAASLSADRPAGTKSVGNASCVVAATGDAGLSIEWLEADRDDRLTVKFGCPVGAGAGDRVAERLRLAPDALGLKQLAFP